MSTQGANTQFHVADYVVFAASLALSAGIGVYYGLCDNKKGKKSADEGLTGGKSMGIVPVSFSVLASFLAAPFVIGTPGEMYCFGTMYSIVVIGFGMATPFVAHVLIPSFHKLDIANGYQYLEIRYNKHIRMLGSAVFAIMMILYMAVVVYAPALAFSQVTGLSLLVSVLGVGVICTFYTAVGGLKAVMWIDVIQMCIILSGLLALVIKGCIDAGGISNVWSKSVEGGRIIFDDVSPDPRTRHTWWTQTIGASFTTMVLIGINQAIVQKYLSIPKVKDAQKTPYLAWGLLVAYMLLVCFAGLVMYAFYYDCDPLTRKIVKTPDQLIPLFMMDVLGKLYGIPGLFTATVFAATLSTVAAGVNALAAITYMDAVQPLYFKFKGEKMSPLVATLSSKGLAVLYGALTIGLAYLAPLFGDTLLQIAISIFGVAGGPLLGLFFLGLFMPFTNAYGAMVGTLGGMAFSFWIAIGAIITKVPQSAVMLPFITNCSNSEMENTTAMYITTMTSGNDVTVAMTTIPQEEESGSPINELYKVSYMWYTLIAVASTVLIGIVVSLITGCNKNRVVNPETLFTCQDCLHPRNAQSVDTKDDTEKNTVTVVVNGNLSEKPLDVSDIIVKEEREKDNGVINVSYIPDHNNDDITKL